MEQFKVKSNGKSNRNNLNINESRIGYNRIENGTFQSIELIDLIGNANTELLNINGEIEVQNEKLKGVQEKLGIHRQTLENNWTVLNRLKESTKMERIFKTIFWILLVFFVLYFIAKYAKFTVDFKDKKWANWINFKNSISFRF